MLMGQSGINYISYQGYEFTKNPSNPHTTSILVLEAYRRFESFPPTVFLVDD